MRKVFCLLHLALLAGIGCSRGSNQILSVTSVTPSSFNAGTPTTITVVGEQFSTNTSIELGKTVVPTTLVSPTEMTAVLPASIVNVAGSYPLSIVDSEPPQQGGTGVLATNLTISVQSPAPLATSLSPTTLLAGLVQATVVINGSNFTPGTTATLNGTAHGVTFQDTQHVALQLNAADLLVAQTVMVVLTNPAPGGGTTAPLTLQLTNYTKAAQTYTAYGDSITYGYQLASVTSAYPYLLAANAGLTLTDFGVIADQACDTFSRVNKQHDGYTQQSNFAFSYMIGTNDTYVKGSGAYEAVFNACDQGVLSWLGLPASAKVQAGNAMLQVSGGCTNTPYAARFGAAYCSAAGTISDQAFVSYGAPIYLWVLLDDTAPPNSAVTVTVDGSTAGTSPVATTPTISTYNHSTSSVGLLRIPVAAGIHAITLTASGSGAGLLGMGTVPASQAGLPPVVVGDVPVQRVSSPYATTAVQLAYSADVRANVALLRGDGLDLRFAADRDTMQGTAAEMADSLHPNVLGQQHLAAAFETGLVGLNGTGGVVAQVARGMTVLPAEAIVAIAPRTTGAAFRLAAGGGALVTLHNRSPAIAAWVEPPLSGDLIDGSTGLMLEPGAVITLRRTERTDRPGWTVVRSSNLETEPETLGSKE